MFDTMDDRGFVEFLAALWEQRGWETGVQEDDPGQFMITGDKASGERALMMVHPDSDATVAGQPVQSLVGICDAKNVDLGVVATRGEFTDDAERIAAANDIHLLDTEALETTVEAEGLEDVVEEFAHGSSGSVLGQISLSGIVPAVFRTPSPRSIPTRGLTSLLLIVGVVAIGLVGLQSMGMLGADSGPLAVGGFELGDDDSDEFTVTAASLTEQSDEGISIAWTATRQQTATVGNDSQYKPPDGEQFVVVEMQVTNEGTSTAALRTEDLGFAANDVLHQPHRLEGAAGQPPVVVEPGQSESVWVVFTVDADVTSGTLLGIPGEDGAPMRFERDPSVDRPLTGD
jgi:hypothetical protein